MERQFKMINLKEEDEKNQEDDQKNQFHYTSPCANEKKIAKPDFSPILIEETQFGFKTNGSYKKRKFFQPESPIKLMNKNYSTAVKIKGRDLFNSKKSKPLFRKLNFNDEEEEEKIQNSNEDNKNINNINKGFCFNMFDLNFVDNIKSYLKQNKMENEFLILKTIKNNKLDFVYKVEEKNSKKIYCIKKIYKNSKKNDINNTKKLFNDMLTKNQFRNNIINDNHFLLGYDFCNHYKDFWIEDENFVLNYNNLFMPEKYLYILYDYYPNGDLLDYLEKLEKIEYKFTPDFYWDIIFEMIMGLKYFHELGYLHLDIKPTNFLVDQKGYLKLTDFGLCHKISEIPFLTDIIEGDKIYISKELFNFNSQGILNTKTDVFSLGLSILEIIAKINLPSSGESWAELRSDNFQIKEKLLENWNINENKDKFVNLISRMITPIDKRADLGELIKNFEELNKRYELLINNKYKKSGEIPELNNIINCKVNIIHID